MAYKCLDCGHIFDEGEQEVWCEDHGFDSPPYERWGICPICGGDYEETTPCANCGSEHLEDELSGGVCDECIDEYRKDFDRCYELSIGETTEIKINSLLASLFDVSDIEQILKEFIRDKLQDVDCSPFIDEDISWFGEKIAEEVNKNENAKG
jgi:DNA-directed RNA polymerase subunit RPC12/RpoP